MSNLFYPLDETGKAASNKVNEFQSMVTLANDNRIIVPNATPFFKEGLVVTHWPSGKVLVENSDFYLGYRYRELENEINTPIYGCIVITNLGLEGSFELDYQTIGGNYVKPQPKVLEYLTNYLTNPRITDWDNVVNKPPSNPVKEHRYSHHDHVNLDDVEGELMNLRDAIERYRQELGDATFDGLTIRLHTLEEQMIASGLNAHQHDTNNEHNTTYTQTGALGANQSAVNAIKAFNKTLTEFTKYCYDNGVTQQDLDTLLPLASNHELLENLILPTTSYIRDVNGKVTLDVGNALAKLMMDGSLTLSADNTLNGNGRSILKAGDNQLEVVSSGQGIDTDALLYNGSVVLNTGNVKRLMVAVQDAIYYITTADGSNTKASGNGSPSNPLRIDGDLPTATTSVKGETTITKTVNSDNTKAVASSPLADITAEVVTKLDDDVTINGHPVKDDPVLNSSDISLGEVDNTSDLEKPISDPQQALLDEYAPKVHRHNSTDIYVPLASQTQQGYAAYSADDAPYTGGDGEVSTINWYRIKYEEAIYYRDSTLGGVPSDLLPVVSYGTPDYLPIPATGYFGGSGWGGNGYAAVMEAGKRVVYLRAGRDYFERALYYHVVKLNDDDSLDYAYPLTTTYLPKLSVPGEKPIVILSSCNTAMTVLSDLDKRYLIEFNDTMDATKHRVTPIAADYGKMVDAGDSYAFTSANVSSGSGMYINLWLIAKASLGSLSEIAATEQVITGNKHNGQAASSTAFYYVDSQKKVSTATGNDICVVDDLFGKGGSVRHATQNILLGYQDGKIRVYMYARPYFSNSLGSVTGGTWNISFTIDLMSNNRVVMDIVPDFPIRITADDKFTFGNLLINTSNPYPGGSPNNVSFGNELGNGYESYNWQQSTQNIPGINISKRYDPSVTWFESLDMNVRSCISVWSGNLIGTTFSGIGAGMKGCAPLVKNNVFIRPTTGNWLIAEVDPDNFYPGQGDKSFGYTPNSTLMSSADAVKILRTPYTFTASAFDGSNPATEKNCGAVWWTGDLSQNWEWDGSALSGSAVCAQSVYDAVYTQAKSFAEADNSEVHQSDKLFIYSHSISEIPMFYQYSRMTLMASGAKRNTMYIGFFDCNNRQNPTAITTSPYNVWVKATHSSATSLGVSTSAFEGVQIGKMKDGTYQVCANMGTYVGYVGNGGALGFGFKVTPNTHVVTSITYWANHAYRTDGYKLYGTKGMYVTFNDSSGTTALGNWCDQDYTAVTNSVVMWSSVAVGNWTFFISNTVNTYAKGVAGSLAAINYDLSLIYPSSHASNKFYLYFNHAVADSQGYILTDQVIPDSNDTTYLGIIETDDIGITNIDIRSVLKWGILKELREHEADRGAHGYGSIDKSTFNLDLLENKSNTTVLNPPTFQEVFDTWYRYSHNANNVYPALPAETTSWSFNASTDAIACTINSSSEIGFVSQDAYTDYEFDTYVSSSNGDDDWVGVVLAFEVDSYGGEHTIVLMRATYANGKNIVLTHRHVSDIGVVTTKTLYLGGTSTPVGWTNAGKSRLRIQREGDFYTIQVYSFDGAGYEQGDASKIVDTITLDLADYPEMEIFKGASRFGYACRSQASSTWANLVRPDADGRSYYGTNALLYNAYHGWGDGLIRTNEKSVWMQPTAAGTHRTDTIEFELPEGYTPQDCDLAISLRGWALADATNGLKDLRAVVDKVNGTYYLEATQSKASSGINVYYVSEIVIGRPSRL